MEIQQYIDDWKILTKFLPDGWEEKAFELGAITRSRKIKSASDLLRLLMIHLTDNCSLKETVTRGRIGELPDSSNVALMKRMRKSIKFLQWINNELIKNKGVAMTPPKVFEDYSVKSVDASVISEPGSTGTDWRLHYCIESFSLNCDQFYLTRQDTGESFKNFTVSPNDLFIGDRAYGSFSGMKYLNDNNAFYITRFRNRAFTLIDENGNKYKLVDKIKDLESNHCQVLETRIKSKEHGPMPIPIIVMKMSDDKAERSVDKAIKEQKKKQRKINEETIGYHRYVILLTNLPNAISANDILELYRLRWQIELSFKELKSIFGLGHLPKEDIESARAWLQGKLFVALLSQTIIENGLLFSPWGYPFKSGIQKE